MENISYGKIVLIGAGHVGSAILDSLLRMNLADEIVVINRNEKKALGVVLDASHTTAFAYSANANIRVGTYEDCKDAQIIINTAGPSIQPGNSRDRMVLLQTNVQVMKEIMTQITTYTRSAIIINVSNPMDILTYIALKESGYPANRVIGSGTVLDTGRFRYELGEHLGVDSRSVHAYIIGEHGDSELAAWSDARVGGLPINDFCELRGHFDHDASMEKIFDHVKNSAYEIIARKHATYYGIAMAVCRICAAIVRDEQSIMPVSSLMQGEYGLEDVVLSIPAVVDANGIETVVPIELSEKELAQLKSSAEILKKIIKENS